MSWLQKQKQPHQLQEEVEGKVTQEPPVLAKPLENQVQATEAKDEAEVVVEEKTVTKYMEDEAGASTAHHTSHKFETSKER